MTRHLATGLAPSRADAYREWPATIAYIRRRGAVVGLSHGERAHREQRCRASLPLGGAREEEQA